MKNEIKVNELVFLDNTPNRRGWRVMVKSFDKKEATVYDQMDPSKTWKVELKRLSPIVK